MIDRLIQQLVGYVDEAGDLALEEADAGEVALSQGKQDRRISLHLTPASTMYIIKGTSDTQISDGLQ